MSRQRTLEPEKSRRSPSHLPADCRRTTSIRWSAKRESHADDDKRQREEIEARNRCESMVYQTEKLLRENRDKIGDADAKNVEAAIADCLKALEEGGLERINKSTETLTQASHKLAEAMYKSGAGSSGGGPGGGTGWSWRLEARPEPKAGRRCYRRGIRRRRRKEGVKSRHAGIKPPRLRAFVDYSEISCTTRSLLPA